MFLVLFWVFSGHQVDADSDDPIGDLEPVIYEKLKFKQNTDYLHDEQKAEMKNTIPVKQFDINFDGSQQLPQKGDTSFVFQEAERGTKSTVAAKTLEIGLFTKENSQETANIPAEAPSQQATGHAGRTLIFIGLIALGMVVMFMVLLPKLIHQPVPVNGKSLK
ncbi:type VII secretion EssA family protein [Sporosarcina sp. NPDC096371]|uniref:type VII secretion EssA family protein n=1 Tax=Sporosarcina sp. NPDC096371 TaxID=3364530 RepID=UPI00381345B3